jgi:hypothetical protein
MGFKGLGFFLSKSVKMVGTLYTRLHGLSKVCNGLATAGDSVGLVVSVLGAVLNHFQSKYNKELEN